MSNLENRIKDDKLFVGSDDVLEAMDLIASRERDFKETETLKPFYLKAINTLRQLLKVDFELPHLYH
jgi:hypothetical protein